MTEIIIAIDLISLIYIIVAIPLIVTLSKAGWAVGEYLKAILDLKWRKARKELKEWLTVMTVRNMKKKMVISMAEKTVFEIYNN